MSAPLSRRSLLLAGSALASGLLGPAMTGCSAAGAPAPHPTSSPRPAWPSGAASLTAAQWRSDLAELDSSVRTRHPDPFAIHPEGEWTAGLAALRGSLHDLPPTRAKIALIRQVALLDTHSGVFPEEVGFHQYGIWFKEFADGVFVTGSVGRRLNGAELLAVGAAPAPTVLQRLRPLLNADNDGAARDLRPWFLIQAEILHALGFTSDDRRSRYALRMPDGRRRVVDVPIASQDDLFGPISDTQFTPDTPPSWRALTSKSVGARVEDRAVILSFTELDQDPTTAITTMRAALRTGAADRVVFDQRYCRGGDYTAADRMREALADPLVRDRLTVITGTDNVSAGSALAEWLRHDTPARFVGAPPPTITNPMLDEHTFTLPNSGVVVHVPTNQWIFDAKEHLREMPMTTAVRDTAASFFHGIDDTVPVALRR